MAEAGAAINPLELYCKGARVWLKDEINVWIPGTVDSPPAEDQLTVTTKASTEIIDISDLSNLPPLRNPEILVGSQDLTHLSYLHEPAVLHNLQVRFCEQKCIYTYCGIVLVAINPYARLPIYTPDVISRYSGADVQELDPHIFAIAEDAYRTLFREGKSQSIIVSGESGAGKTVSAKFAMRYFASVGGADDMTQIEKKILASNPVMEAIGNAKTTRNDNSSRFGKYIEIIFSDQSEIIGAIMRTYLLEKSRLVHQAEVERNYHVFYQLCARAEETTLAELELGDADDFFFTSQGGDAMVPTMNDHEEYIATVEALSTLGVAEDQQYEIFQILAGLLHIGNVDVKQRSKRNEDAVVPEDDTHFLVAATLLGLDDTELRRSLTNRKIQTGKEVFTKPLSCEDATFSIHAFAKHIYAHLFDWIVARVNAALAPPPSKGTASKAPKCIGVLDIYGFEVFEVNSFEQFCINYANEKLQQLFNKHVFKLEQEEYVREEITWSFIDFYDNQPCIDLIEDRVGILGLLDEECMVPKGSDEAWATKMYQKFDGHSHFIKPRLSNSAFVVKHYAYDVQYEVGSFLDKNKDTLYEEHLVLLRDSVIPLLASMFEEDEQKNKAATTKSGTKGTKNKSKTKKTVATQFHESLGQLMDTLNATEPHYIRCIKPNDTKAEFEFDNHRCVEQLRACGVLETVRISAAGYPSRWKFDDFFARYELLAADRAKLAASSPTTRAKCEGILRPLIADEDKFQFGKTKLFFRAGQVAYLEKLRSDKRRAAAIMIQKIARGLSARRQYLSIRRATLVLQTLARARMARLVVQQLREHRAAARIQTTFRRWSAERRFATVIRSVRLLQRHVRGMLGRRHFRHCLEVDRVVVLQTAWRRYRAQQAYALDLQRIIIAQNAVRRFHAIRELRQLKIEARSVAGIQAKNAELAATVQELRQQIAGLQKTTSAQTEEIATLQQQIDTTAAATTAATIDAETHEAVVAELGDVREKLNAAKMHVQDLATEREKLVKDSEELFRVSDQLQSSEAELARLQAENAELHAVQEKLHELEAEQEKLQRENSNLRAADEQRQGLEDALAAAQAENAALQASAAATPLAGDNSSPNADDGEGNDNAEDHSALLATARTDVARLQLANTKLQDKITELEKSTVTRDAKAAAADAEENVQLKERLQEHEDDLMVCAAERDKALEQVEQLQQDLAAAHAAVDVWKDKYERQVEAQGVAGMAAAQSTLEAENTAVAAKLAAAEVAAGELQQQLESATAQAAHLQQDNKKLTKRVKNVEEALGKKIGSGSQQRQPTDMLQEEIRILVEENLDMREIHERLETTIQAYKKMGAKLPKGFDPSGGRDGDDRGGVGGSRRAGTARGGASDGSGGSGGTAGMLIMLRQDDVDRVVNDLILHLDPRTTRDVPTPGLIAHILFMAVLFADDREDGALLQLFLAKTIGGIKEVAMNNSTNLDILAFWMSNTHVLVNIMKHFSGEEQFRHGKSQVPSLKNFDLLEYRKVLSDLLLQVFNTVVKHIEHKLTKLIVPAMLEHEPIPGMNNPNREAPSKSPTKLRPGQRHPTAELVAVHLDHFYKVLSQNRVDLRLIQQVFEQVVYFINATMVNNLLLRKDLCHWTTGIQIRKNLSCIEDWTLQRQMKDLKAILVQATQISQLLQVNKTSMEDVDLIYDTCTELSSVQVQKILSMYTPAQDEERVPAGLIRQVVSRGVNSGATQPQVLMMDAQSTKRVVVPFDPTPTEFASIAIPDALNVGSYLKRA